MFTRFKVMRLARALSRRRPSSPSDRARAATALGALGHPAAVPVLGATLDDPAVEVVIAAANSLGKLGNATAIELLRDRFEFCSFSLSGGTPLGEQQRRIRDGYTRFPPPFLLPIRAAVLGLLLRLDPVATLGLVIDRWEHGSQLVSEEVLAVEVPVLLVAAWKTNRVETGLADRALAKLAAVKLEDERRKAFEAVEASGGKWLTDTQRIVSACARGQFAEAAAYGEAAIPLLGAELDQGNPAVITPFAGLGAPTVGFLLAACGDVNRRGRACEVLARVRDPKAAPAFAEVLRGQDEALAGIARNVLAAIGEAALPPLVELLSVSDDRVRLRAAGVLAAIGRGEAVLPLLVELLSAADDRVRLSAADLLSQRRDGTRLADLPGLAASTRRLLMTVNLERLQGGFPGIAAKHQPDKWFQPNWKSLLQDVLDFMGPLDADEVRGCVLAAYVQSWIPKYYWEGIAEAESWGERFFLHADYVPALSAAIRSRRAELEKDIAAATKRGDMRAFQELCRMNEFPSEPVCVGISRLLARIGDPRAIEALRPLLSDPREPVAKAAAEALAALGVPPGA